MVCEGINFFFLIDPDKTLIRLTKYLCHDVKVSRTACTFYIGTREACAVTREDVRRCQ